MSKCTVILAEPGLKVICPVCRPGLSPSADTPTLTVVLPPGLIEPLVGSALSHPIAHQKKPTRGSYSYLYSYYGSSHLYKNGYPLESGQSEVFPYTTLFRSWEYYSHIKCPNAPLS